MFGHSVFCRFPGCPEATEAPSVGHACQHLHVQHAHAPGRPCKPVLTRVLLSISDCGAKLQALGSFWIHAGGISCYLLLAVSRFSVWLQRSHPLQPPEIPCVGRSALSPLSPWGTWTVLNSKFSFQVVPDFQHIPVLLTQLLGPTYRWQRDGSVTPLAGQPEGGLCNSQSWEYPSV